MKKLQHRFVEFMPDRFEEGILYISFEYCTAIHKCVCGCGNEVVTPLSPTTGWKLEFDGETISLSPSIGNWNFKCRSHYWIKNNEIKYARVWTDREIEESRKRKGNSNKKSHSHKRKKEWFAWLKALFSVGKKTSERRY